MKILAKISTGIVLLALMSTANAGEFFVGGLIGSSDFSELGSACNELEDSSQLPVAVSCSGVDDSDTVFGINAGYNFTNYFGLEVGFVDLGEYQATISAGPLSDTVTAEAEITYAALVFSLPVGNKLSFSARLGAANGDLSASSSLASVTLDDETGFIAGASVDYRIVDKVSLQLRFDDLEILNMVSAGVRFHF